MSRREAAVLAAILTGAAALRVAAAALAFDPDLAFGKFPLLAERLIAGGWVAREPFAYSPAYIYFFAVLMRLGASPLGICAAQVALSVGTCALVWALGRRLFGPAVGAAAAAGAAAYGPFLLYAIEFESDGLGLFLFCAAAVALLRALDGGAKGGGFTPEAFGVAGLLLGLRIMQRPDGLFILALVVGLLVAEAARRAGAIAGTGAGRGALAAARTLRCAAVYTVAALLPVLPIAWQNARASGEFIPVTSSGGWVFYTSQNYAAKGLSYFPPPLARQIMDAPAVEGEDALDRLDDRVSRRLAALAEGRDLAPGESSRFWRQEGVRSIERRGFASQAFLQARRLFYMMHAYDAQDSLPLLIKETRLGWLGSIGMGALAPFALIGFALAFERDTKLGFAPGIGLTFARLPMLGFYLAPVLSMSLFYVGARFRLELAAMLLPLAGLAVVLLAAMRREGRRRAPALAAGAVVVLAGLLHAPDEEIARQQRLRFIQLHTFQGERAKEADAALVELRLATKAAIYPAEAEPAWREVARLEQQRGNAIAAQRALNVAAGVLDGATHARLALRTEDPDAQWAVGRHFMLKGDMDRASSVLGDAARLAPDDPDVLLARALAGFEASALPPDRVAAWAEDALDAGLRFSFNAPTGCLLAARGYERLGELDKAEAAQQAARRYQAFIDSIFNRPQASKEGSTSR
ncbi:MAG TPA: glycosyltransferase family 39 protein [Candidatus Cryosericum sp.]|nr:glycosyltransferase family 39 protein [Candidatus Cryosericum sp.]